MEPAHDPQFDAEAEDDEPPTPSTLSRLDQNLHAYLNSIRHLTSGDDRQSVLRAIRALRRSSRTSRTRIRPSRPALFTRDSSA
ncbi:hypothetical protein JCM6882_009558 [Rhodosporidiobolus microsporus]